MGVPWEWVGRIILVVLSGGTVLFLLNWWKNSREQKVEKISDNAKHLSHALGQVHDIVIAMLKVVNDGPDQIKYWKQASLLWKTHSKDTFLTDWKKYDCILIRKRKTKVLCARFENTVEQLIQKARDWYEADRSWHASVGIIEGEYLVGSTSKKTPEKQNAADQYKKLFDDFFNLYQELGRHIRLLIKN
jgi:hypothetical protein